MKKRRGKRKYYRRLGRLNQIPDYWFTEIDDAESWFDFDHVHFDWSGYGDCCWKERLAHLNALFLHFDILVQAFRKVERKFQVFAVLNERDSGSDALYLHTPNPTGYFPHSDFGYVSECTLTNPNFIGYLEMLRQRGYAVLYSPRGADYPACVVYKENLGEPVG